jgi:hypothetical protein
MAASEKIPMATPTPAVEAPRAFAWGGNTGRGRYRVRKRAVVARMARMNVRVQSGRGKGSSIVFG